MSLATLWRSRSEMKMGEWVKADAPFELIVSANKKHAMAKKDEDIREWEFAGKGTSEEALVEMAKWLKALGEEWK